MAKLSRLHQLLVLEAPDPSYVGVDLWRIGLWDLFPRYAPRAPIRPLRRGTTEKCIELTRFTDLSGAVALGERLPLSSLLPWVPGPQPRSSFALASARWAGLDFSFIDRAGVTSMTLFHDRRLGQHYGVIGDMRPGRLQETPHRVSRVRPELICSKGCSNAYQF